MTEEEKAEELRRLLDRDAKALSGAAKKEAVATPPDEIRAVLERDRASMMREKPPVDVARAAGVGARALVSGAPSAVFGLPALTADAYDSLVNLLTRGVNLGAQGINAVAGTDIQQRPYIPPFRSTRALAQAGEALAGMTPLPAPETPAERVATSGIEGILGAATGAGAGALARIPLRAAAQSPSQMLQASAQQASAGLVAPAQQAAIRSATQLSEAAAANPILAAAGAGTGAAAAQTSQELGGSAGQNLAFGLLGSIAPGVAAKAGGRVITPFDTRLNPEQQRLLQIAQGQYGIQPTAGASLGIPWLRNVEELAGDMPGAISSKFTTEGQRRDFTRAALSEANIGDELATPKALDVALKTKGGEIGAAAQGEIVNIATPKFANTLSSLISQNSQIVDDKMQRLLFDYIGKLTPYSGKVPGETYQKIRSDLTERANSYAKENTTSAKDTSRVLKGLRNALDEAFRDSVTPQKGELVDILRKEYANTKSILSAMGGPAGSRGEISGPKLAQALEREGGEAYRRGYGNLNELGRVGQQFYALQPSSGTEQRQFARAMLSPGARGMDALKAAASVPFGAISSGAVLNPVTQAWLRNQALSGNRPPLLTLLGPTGAIQQTASDGLLGQ